jgi:hypothetical protein
VGLGIRLVLHGVSGVMCRKLLMLVGIAVRLRDLHELLIGELSD